MSVHLLIAAAYLEGIPQGTKLVLMAVADSADEHTLESAPGLPKLRAWSGLAKSTALERVADLVASRLIERVEAGRLGRRAVYRVFPDGVPAIPRPSEVASRYIGSGPLDPPPSSTGVYDPVDENPDRVQPTGPIGSSLSGSRVQPTGPLHAVPSVLTRERPSTTAPATGFPGARRPDVDVVAERDAARRARGAQDTPCPRHPEQVVPCGRCAHAAAEALRRDPDLVARSAQAARAAIAANRPTTEETPKP